jgi:hypothetical protein
MRCCVFVSSPAHAKPEIESNKAGFDFTRTTEMPRSSVSRRRRDREKKVTPLKGVERKLDRSASARANKRVEDAAAVIKTGCLPAGNEGANTQFVSVTGIRRHRHPRSNDTASSIDHRPPFATTDLAAAIRPLVARAHARDYTRVRNSSHSTIVSPLYPSRTSRRQASGKRTLPALERAS